MKYQQFADLCAREHENGGDVVALDLTSPSAAEFARDILATPGPVTVLSADPAVRAAVGGRVTRAVNPTTHSDVAIKVSADADADFDMATVIRPVAVRVASA